MHSNQKDQLVVIAVISKILFTGWAKKHPTIKTIASWMFFLISKNLILAPFLLSAHLQLALTTLISKLTNITAVMKKKTDVVRNFTVLYTKFAVDNVPFYVY
jgi:hypothetical protein